MIFFWVDLSIDFYRLIYDLTGEYDCNSVVRGVFAGSGLRIVIVFRPVFIIKLI